MFIKCPVCFMSTSEIHFALVFSVFEKIINFPLMKVFLVSTLRILLLSLVYSEDLTTYDEQKMSPVTHLSLQSNVDALLIHHK